MSTQSNNARLIDVKALQNIIAKRGMIRITDIGSTMRFHVQGNGNIIPAMKNNADGTQSQAMSFDGVTPLNKRIYNIRANSQMAMQNKRNQDILHAAVKAEAEGKTEEASALLNDYLNKTQASFSYLLNPGTANKEFYDGQLVEGEVSQVTTDKGTTVVLENVRAVLVAKVGATPAFTLSDLLGIDDSKKADPKDVFTDKPVVTVP